MIKILLFIITTRIIIVGDVKDAETGEPLAYATIGTKNHIDQTVSDENGKFQLSLPASAGTDTLVVTYIGYEKFQKPIPQLASFEHIKLIEYATVLDEVRIVHQQIDIRDIDRNMRVIRGNLYAMQHEVTNIEYNDFLSWLEDYNKLELKERYDYDLSAYKKSVQEFYKVYHKISSVKEKRNQTTDSVKNFNNFPAINISYESAVEYCKWLTTLYNESPKKKRYKKVVFRLPTLNEWQIAALGDPKFQSWNLLENMVESIVSKDTMDMFKGPRKKLSVADDEVLYPWYSPYFLRNRVYNNYGCYLGNFKISLDRNCVTRAFAYDGSTIMSRTEWYFPNGMGLYDVVGNVAEMIDKKGKACGGSWNDPPEQSTIHSVKNFSGPDESVGFRVFMEVIEQ